MRNKTISYTSLAFALLILSSSINTSNFNNPENEKYKLTENNVP